MMSAPGPEESAPLELPSTHERQPKQRGGDDGERNRDRRGAGRIRRGVAVPGCTEGSTAPPRVNSKRKVTVT